MVKMLSVKKFSRRTTLVCPSVLYLLLVADASYSVARVSESHLRAYSSVGLVFGFLGSSSLAKSNVQHDKLTPKESFLSTMARTVF